jgi:hypothetical protein
MNMRSRETKEAPGLPILVAARAERLCTGQSGWTRHLLPGFPAYQWMFTNVPTDAQWKNHLASSVGRLMQP